MLPDEELLLLIRDEKATIFDYICTNDFNESFERIENFIINNNTTLIKQSNSEYWKKCKKCGEEYIYKEHKFCPGCGRKILK